MHATGPSSKAQVGWAPAASVARPAAPAAAAAAGGVEGSARKAAIPSDATSCLLQAVLYCRSRSSSTADYSWAAAR